jgi:hypothetical protein
VREDRDGQWHRHRGRRLGRRRGDRQDGGRLVVELRRGAGGPGQPVDRHVGEHLVAVHGVLGEAVAAGPVPELLHDPGELAHRRVGERVGERLRAGGLEFHVAGLVTGRETREETEPGQVARAQAGQRRGVVRRRGREQQVDVHAQHRLRRHLAEHQRHHRAEVAALGHVPLVAEPAHQLGPGRGDPDQVPAGLPQRAGETVAGHRRDDQVDRVGGVPAVRHRVGQRVDHLEELGDRAGPAVREQDRCGVRLGGAHVQEVHPGAVDLGDELRVPVDGGLGGTPVVVVLPVVGELLEVVHRHAAVPAGVGQVVGPACAGQPLLEVVEVGLGDVDPERFHSGAPTGRRCSVRARRGPGRTARGWCRRASGRAG